MNKTALCGILSMFATVSANADFRAEFDLGMSDIDVEGAEGDGYLAGGTVYFSEVDTSKGPLAEASFLDKSSGLGFFLAGDDVDGLEEDDSYSVSGRFVFAQEYILEAIFTDADSDSTYGFGVGKYVSDNAEVVVSYTELDTSENQSLNINYHSVVSIGDGASLAYDLGASYLDANTGGIGDTTGHGFNGGVTYYPMPSLGVGADVSYNTIGDVDTTGFGIDARYFFDEAFAASLNYSVSSVENDTVSASTDTDTISLGITFRF